VSGLTGIRKRLYERAPVWMQNEICTLVGRRLQRQRYGGEYEKWSALWAQSRGWTREALEAYQCEQVRELLERCYRSVPHYSEEWRRHGVRPEDFRGLEDLVRFPCTTKDQVFEGGLRFVAEGIDPRSLIRITTGGSTGQPLVLYRTAGELQRHYAVIWDRMRPGVRRNDLHASFQGREVVPANRTKPPYWRDNRAARQRLYSIQHLSPSMLREFARDLVRTPFVYYEGYANFLLLVAEAMAEQSIRPDPPPAAVFSTSNQLSGSGRRLMEETWRTKVWDDYGQAECAALIRECEHGGKHVQMDYGVVEFEVVGSEDGLEVAELICTGFVPQAMPLIRYRVGDLVLLDRAGGCRCGEPAPVIRGIRGRTAEYLILPDGRYYPTVTHLADQLPGIRRMQIVQERLGGIVVRVVPKDRARGVDPRAISERLAERLHPGLEISVEVVDELERLPNGKVLSIINRVPGHRRGVAAATEGA